ncbi:hypothetical protein LTR56_003371 [Elasticomyces elasticus]|nr:hypothetical protein LTR56_003371 [Elasticomyces elasticus]KAK3664211.1 hypothetical protein LTR22_004909 [Elasticomyces elasticus]KAK4931426.1 hypothetical protein LTR49_002127 [Elasticomyces elasticus]KAK5766054.1 hypothetical protein LTS12_003800 [Elasticomyces elasticus]
MEADYIEQVSLYRGLLDIEIRKVQRLSEELKHARHTIAEMEQQREQDIVNNTELAAESVLVKEEDDDNSSDSAHKLEAARQRIAELQEALAAQESVSRDAATAGSKRKRSNVEHSEDSRQLHERATKEMSSAPSSSRSSGNTDEPSYRSIEATQENSSESVETRAHPDTSEHSTGSHKISEADITASHISGLLSIIKVSRGPDAEQYEEATNLSLTVQKKIVELERLVKDGAVVEFCRNSTSSKCLRVSRVPSGTFSWTKEHPGSYACLTCTNLRLPCIARNYTTNTWELLPLAPGLPRGNTAADDDGKYILAKGRGTFTNSIAGRHLRSLWRDNPNKVSPKPATRH